MALTLLFESITPKSFEILSQNLAEIYQMFAQNKYCNSTYTFYRIMSICKFQYATGVSSITVKPGNKLEGDVRDIVSLKAQTFPYFQLVEKFKCMEHIDKSETQLKTSP